LLASFTVTSAADPFGLERTTTLRQAIEDSNDTPGHNTINFNIPGPGVHTISLASPLPPITVPVSINETSPGYSGSPLIQIDGLTYDVQGDGLTLDPYSGGSTIRGLDIYGFSGDGVFVLGASSNTFKSCNFSRNGFAGIDMSAADSNTVTGCTFSGNSSDGVYMANASENSVSSCTFSGNQDGVYMAEALENSVSSCTFSGNQDGVYMAEASKTSVSSCTFSGNSFSGVSLSNASNH